MRSSCEWFATRAVKAWSAHPARSFLVLAPQGCDDERAAQLVMKWSGEHFKCPAPFGDHLILLINVVSDNQITSHHFASRVSAEVERKCGISLHTAREDYPSDIILNAIEGALASGAYPILLIERFHAFAQIRDGAMHSVLSQLRTLEMDRKLTTIAFSPMTYDAIRKSMDGEQAFLNSVYGDSHEQVVLNPISREEFVVYALKLGVAETRAQQAYTLAGGPDKVFSALASALVNGDVDPVSYCVRRCDATIAAFFDRTLYGAGKLTDVLLGGLSVGRLQVPEEAYLKANPMLAFFATQAPGGALRCSTPILSRWVLSNRAGPWSPYGKCLELLRAGTPIAAAELARGLISDNRRLSVFPALVSLFCALSVDLARPFFGLDWVAIDQACKSVLACGDSLPSSFQTWSATVSRWSNKMKRSRSASRLQSEAIIRQAADDDTRQLILFMVVRYLTQILNSGKSSHLDSLVMLPEVLLQTLAVGLCQVDFADVPQLSDAYNYQNYFSGTQPFKIPERGSKLTLASLLVIVPTVLREIAQHPGLSITDAAKIRPLHGSLIEQIRNVSAHSVVELSNGDRAILKAVCEAWVSDWITLEGFNDASEIPGIIHAPSIDDLEALLIGD